jgi:antitoxin component YwqK of YwqJK toxin-antitoxin module
VKQHEIPWKNGNPEGIRKEWNEDGNLAFQGNYVDGTEEIK